MIDHVLKFVWFVKIKVLNFKKKCITTTLKISNMLTVEYMYKYITKAC